MSVLLQETPAFCARNMGAHVQHTSPECQGYEKRGEKLDSRAAKKDAKKLVTIKQKYLNVKVATKI